MRLAWIRSNRQGETPRWGDVDTGMQLPTPRHRPAHDRQLRDRVALVHVHRVGLELPGGTRASQEAGWLPEMERNLEAGEEDPALADGLYRGPSRGHADKEHAQLIGMPRGLRIRRVDGRLGARLRRRTGPATRVSCATRTCSTGSRPSRATSRTSTARSPASAIDETLGVSLVTLEVVMSTQDGAVMAKGPVEVELPRARGSGPDRMTTFRGAPAETEEGIGALTLERLPPRGDAPSRRARGSRLPRVRRRGGALELPGPRTRSAPRGARRARHRSGEGQSGRRS